jgi:hypothetical protein
VPNVFIDGVEIGPRADAPTQRKVVVDLTPRCKVADCGKVIDSKLLMCADHWSMVPPKIKAQFTQRARNVGSDLKRAAIEAVESVERRRRR